MKRYDMIFLSNIVTLFIRLENSNLSIEGAEMRIGQKGQNNYSSCQCNGVYATSLLYL